MRLSIEPTAEFFMSGDVMCRLWRGTVHHDGLEEPCVALVSAVAFAAEGPDVWASLVSVPPPDGEQARGWAAEVLSKRYDGDGA
jgi:hypothetical protein